MDTIKKPKNIDLPLLIALEVTRQCVLNCVHCRAGAEDKTYKDELITTEILNFLKDVASFSKPIIILTGGEPMLRDDIFDIAKYGTELGLRMVMAPCGILVTEGKAKKMIESGIKRISLSLDGATRESHDKFRGQSGSFDAVIRAMENAKKVGLEFQINTTITKDNIDELEKILEIAIKSGAVAFHPFLLVPSGRAKGLIDKELSADEYEKTLNRIYELQKKTDILFKPTCAPHYLRIVKQNLTKEKNEKLFCSPDSSVGDIDSQKKISSHSLHHLTKGCMGGQTFAFVSHIGKVQICGFLDLECGDIRKEPFSKIWNKSEIFNKLRNMKNYKGKCGVCEYLALCGGCRARAFAMYNDYLAEEPFCSYLPSDLKR